MSTIRGARHDGDLSTALVLGRNLGQAIPDCVEIIGIEAEEVERFSDDLTGNVYTALLQAVDAYTSGRSRSEICDP